jgi:hypothetical protein
MIQEIAQFIEDQTSLTIGVDLFVGHLPSMTQGGTVPPLRLASVMEKTPSATDGYWPDYEQKEIQVLVKGQSYFTARALAYEIYRALHGQAGWRLPVLTSGEEYIANTIDGVSPPYPLENPEEKGIFLFSTNFIFRITKL